MTLAAPLQAHLQSPYGLLAMRLGRQNQGLDTPVLWIDYSFLYLPSSYQCGKYARKTKIFKAIAIFFASLFCFRFESKNF